MATITFVEGEWYIIRKHESPELFALLCDGNPPMTDDVLHQRASNAGSGSMLCHGELILQLFCREWWIGQSYVRVASKAGLISSHLWQCIQKHICLYDSKTRNGSWCMGIKGEMSSTGCVTFTWDMYIYIYVYIYIYIYIYIYMSCL